MIGDEELERMSCHRRQAEVRLPSRVRRSALGPLGIGPAPRPVQRSSIRVKPSQTPAMASLARERKHCAGTASNIKDGVCGHNHLVVETVAGKAIRIPWVQYVIQRGCVSIREHRDSIGSQAATINWLSRADALPRIDVHAGFSGVLGLTAIA
jgi:hypothetical protein